MTLFFDVWLDDLVGHIAARHAKVSAGPEVASPELLSQMWELMPQLVRTLPFQHLNEPADSQARRHAHEQMKVIAGDMPFHDRDFMRAADFADQFTQSCADFTPPDGFAILRDPDEVQVNAKNRMRAMPIVCHGWGL